MIGRHVAATLVAMALAAPAGAAAADRAAHPRAGINARQHRQAERIRNGVENKELTRGELDKLKADEAGIRAEERVYRRSGGGLNARERRDLQHDLDKTSREIYRAKHNNRTPE